MAKIHSFHETGERHGVLRFLAKVCQGFGYLLIVVAAAAVVAGFVWGGSRVNFVPATFAVRFGISLLWALGLFAAGIQSLALGSFLLLAIQVEENTRATAQALDRLRPALDLKADIDPRSMFLS